MTSELTTRQKGVVNRLGRIEGHLNDFASDQNNALESSQATWRNIQGLRTRAAEMNLRIQDMGSELELKIREAQGVPNHEMISEMKKELYEAHSESRGSFLMHEAALGQMQIVIGECHQKYHQLHTG